ncbi:M23 family metallopeptidase [Streptomyces iconiensis]|uniref:M23 family metallopeptidase n=1 Tax=Streptomyces iconiensis TaxID=1384038 RepID=A0ABT6ZYQ1_9ACTN|nr:M23 family metallopeptidase [Streptomyces iconiensis]MDJ1134207.1 M23 family metallopeptidase [Streptomyces iconiensis]
MLVNLWKRYGLVFAAGAVCIVVNVQGIGPLWYTGVALLIAGRVMRVTLIREQRPPPGREPLLLRAPVTGRWLALNGPATKVPSHTHSHAQTYAIDLKYVPEGGGSGQGVTSQAPPFRWLWPLARSPRRYPTFGRPLLAPADGVVVATAGGQRDHLSRMSLPAFLFLYLEGFIRGLGWPSHLLGNHIVLNLGDGVYAAFAHLRRGSLEVAVGDRVSAGQQIAECGNSGNSSEPHLHFQLMNGPDVMTAQGVPFAWRYRDDDGVAHTGVPADTTHCVPLSPLPDRPYEARAN